MDRPNGEFMGREYLGQTRVEVGPKTYVLPFRSLYAEKGACEMDLLRELLTLCVIKDDADARQLVLPWAGEGDLQPL